MSAWLREKEVFLFFSLLFERGCFQDTLEYLLPTPHHVHTLSYSHTQTHTSEISGLRAKKLSTNYQKHSEALINYSHEH